MGLGSCVSVASEICFGRCREGANLFTCPVGEWSPFVITARPNPTAPGAAFHHAMTEAEAIRIIERIIGQTPDRMGGPEDLGIAANR
jgi:hypothetical protein